MASPRYAYMEPDQKRLADLARASIIDGQVFARMQVREEGNHQVFSAIISVLCWALMFWYGRHGDTSMVCSFGFQGLCMFAFFQMSVNSQRQARRAEREFERDLRRFDLEMGHPGPGNTALHSL